MNEAEAFMEIAERSIKAGDAAVIAGVHELGSFLANHAFECTGGALCRSKGVHFHPLTHPKKIRTFINTAKPYRYGHSVATLPTMLISLRNPCLYPRITPSGTVNAPKAVLTVTQAQRLLGRVKSFGNRPNLLLLTEGL